MLSLKMIFEHTDKLQAPVVRRLDRSIHRINCYPVDGVVCFLNTYALDSTIHQSVVKFVCESGKS